MKSTQAIADFGKNISNGQTAVSVHLLLCTLRQKWFMTKHRWSGLYSNTYSGLLLRLLSRWNDSRKHTCKSLISKIAL